MGPSELQEVSRGGITVQPKSKYLGIFYRIKNSAEYKQYFTKLNLFKTSYKKLLLFSHAMCSGPKVFLW